VATRSIDARDHSSPVFNHAHANQTIDMSGAVIPGPPATGLCRWGGIMLASVPPVRVSGIEIPVRPLQPRNQRNQTAARSLSIAGVVRFARLCVLIEPNPVRRSVTRTLTGLCILIDAVRRAFLSNPPNLAKAASSNGGHRASISDDAVSTYKLCSCGPEIPAIPQEGVAVQSCFRSLSTGSRFSLRTGACVRSSPRPAPRR
jgi:hypothetical protein